MPDLLRAWSWAWDRIAGRRRARRPAFMDAYDAVFASIEPRVLRQEGEDLEEEALLEELFRVDGGRERFLDHYSEEGARWAFERYGFFDRLRALGFDPVLTSDLSDPDEHRLRIHDAVEDKAHRLIELFVSVRPLRLPDGTDLRMLHINWLQMQDPRAAFPPERPPLPEQEHPGLGLFLEFSYLLRLVGERIQADGLMNHPSHPHHGALYGRFCRFVDPALEGTFRALTRDVDTSDLADFTAHVRAGRVVDADGAPFVWRPEPQVLPISRRAKGWFRSRRYRDQRDQARERARFRVLDASGDAAP